jgi:hypothetical protein
MGRKISAKIEFEFDESLIDDGQDNPPAMTDEQLTQYAIDNFVNDIYTMVKYNELHGAVRTEIKGEK